MGIVEDRPASARVGTIAWGKPHWRGHFYPPGLPQARWLGYAAERLRTIEIDVTYYADRTPTIFRGWRDQVPEDFVFAVKGQREVAHTRLEGADDRVVGFLATGVLELGEKLGPLLWQLPPRQGFQPELLESFLAALPHSVDEARLLVARAGLPLGAELRRLPDRPLRHALEVRNTAFANERFLELLHRHDVAAVRTNTPPWPIIDAVTSDFGYLRLHGDAKRFPAGYDDAAVLRMAEFVRGWLLDAGADVFVYFDNPDHGGIRSPFDAIRLQQLLGDPPPRPGVTVQPPLWG